MDTEFEAKFLKVDVAKLRQQLKELGAICVKSERLMRRKTYNPPTPINGGWLRVRDEGDKITMSLKVVAGDAIADQKETQLVIDSYERGCRFLEAAGASFKAEQETRREEWRLGEVEFAIDTWPGPQPFVEIEAPTEAAVREVAKSLGFDWSVAVFGAVEKVYQLELGIPPEVINNYTPEITFANPPQPYARS